MSLGRRSQVIVIVMLVISIGFQGALSETPPSHENFEEAEQNLEILLSLLEDSKLLCEDTLFYLVNMEYSKQNLSIAMAKARKFHLSLIEAETLLNNMNGEATSYYYLEEYLTPFQNLDFNTSDLIQYYRDYKDNLAIVENYFNDTASSGITADTAFQALNNTEFYIELVKNKVDSIESNTEIIEQKGFSTMTLEDLIIGSRQLIGSDENTTNEFAELFIGIHNYLSIYVYKTVLALGDELNAYGNFFLNGSYISGHKITIFLDDQILDEVSTDITGRYEFKKNIPLNYTLGGYEIYASTIHNNIPYQSNRIYFTVSKVPTKLTLFTLFPEYHPNQPIPFVGRLVDYRGQGLAYINITLNFNDSLGNELFFNNITIRNISTDIEGNYHFELNTTNIQFGLYGARASFVSDDVYTGSISDIINVSINIPTTLTMTILETMVFEGDNITISGQLIDEPDKISLNNVTIEIYIEDQIVGEVFTNNAGQYEYRHSTFGMAIGKYLVYSEFNPIDIEWRKAKSDIIELEIMEPEEPISVHSKSILEQVYNNLFLIILLIFIFLLPMVFYMKKKKMSLPSVRLTPLLGKEIIKKSYPKKALTGIPLKEKENFDDKLKSLKEIKNLREAIISGYQSLLSIFEKYNIIKIKPSHTHLDVHKELADNGFPRAEISSITKIFEKAMYSRHPIENHTLNDFMIYIKKIFALAKED